MITDHDIQRIKNALKDTFATKEDLKNFATKEDLKQFQTKDEAKESFNILVDQMQTVIHVIGTLSEKVTAIESKIDAMNIQLHKTDQKAEDALNELRLHRIILVNYEKFNQI